MSRKNNIKQFQSIVSGDMSQTSITSTVTDIQFLDNIGIELVWSGSPTGTFQVQISANYSQDPNGNVLIAGNWVPLLLQYWNGSTFVTTTDIPTSIGSPVYLDLIQLSAPYIRVVYTKGSGTGTLQAYITSKMI